MIILSLLRTDGLKNNSQKDKMSDMIISSKKTQPDFRFCIHLSDEKNLQLLIISTYDSLYTMFFHVTEFYVQVIVLYGIDIDRILTIYLI